MNAPGSRPHSAHWLLLALLGGYCWLVAGQLRAPLAWDEVNFFWNGQAVAEIGVPFANAGFLGDRGVVGSQFQFGLWHPPLYLYTLGLAFKLFSASETTARGTGVVLMAGTAILTYWLARLVIPPPARDWGALLAAALLLVSPLAIQSALVLDIDGTVLTLNLVLCTLLYLRVDAMGRLRPYGLALVAEAFTLALWAKLTTPFFLLGVMLVYQTLRWRPHRAILDVAIVGVGGAALFLLTWGLACERLGMPFEMPFMVTWAELHDAVGGSEGELLERLEPQLLPILAWVSPYLAALFAGASVARVAALARHRRLEAVDFLAGVGIVICAVYFVKLAAGFPKYHVAMLPFWAVVVAHWLSTTWARVPRLALPTVALLTAGALGIAFSYAFLNLADSWMFEPRTLERLDAIGLGLLAAFFLCHAAWLRSPGFAAPLVGATAALYVGWAASADWYHAWVPYSTNYWYGTRGQREIAAVVDEVLTERQVAGPYIGAKEAVFYTRDHNFVDQDTVVWLWSDRGQAFDGRWQGHDVPLVVAWIREPSVRQVLERSIEREFEPYEQRYDYLLYVRRTEPLERPSSELAAGGETTGGQAEASAAGVASAAGLGLEATTTTATPPTNVLAADAPGALALPAVGE